MTGRQDRVPRKRIGLKRRILVLLCIPACLPAMACAELTLSGGAEYLLWRETGVPEVKETGPVYTLGLAYTQNREAGALFAYRGRIWGGTVNYNGAALFGGTPMEGDTNYAGIGNELQIRWRRPGKAGGNLDGVLGAGLDVWRRSLTSVQQEDYAVGHLRIGVESGTDESSRWTVALGLKLPVWTYENAHLDRIGFDSNPILHPGREMSPYGSLGYRWSEKLQIVGYYDGFRLGKSETVHANEIAAGLGSMTLFQPATTLSVYGLRLEYRLR
jgi:hypothetical protein